MKKVFWNPNEKRLRAGWRIGLQGFIFTSLSGVVALFLVILLLLFRVENLDALDLGSGNLVTGWMGLLSAISSSLGILVSLYLAALFIDRRPFSDFGFHLEKYWWRQLGFGLLLGGALMAGIFSVEYALGWVTINDPATGFFTDSSQLIPVIQGLFVYTLVGFYEEAYFRGYLLRNLAEGLNFLRLGSRGALLIAWFLSSVVFGILHALNPNSSLVSTVNIAFAGIFLGFGYILTGELAIPVGLHISWNFFQGMVFGFSVSGIPASKSIFSINQGGPDWVTGGAFGPEAGFIGLVYMSIGCLLTLYWIRRHLGRFAVMESLAEYLPRTKTG